MKPNNQLRCILLKTWCRKTRFHIPQTFLNISSARNNFSNKLCLNFGIHTDAYFSVGKKHNRLNTNEISQNSSREK